MMKGFSLQGDPVPDHSGGPRRAHCVALRRCRGREPSRANCPGREGNARPTGEGNSPFTLSTGFFLLAPKWSSETRA